MSKSLFLKSSHKHDVFIVGENGLMTDALLKNICRNGTAVMHACTALPGDGASVDGGMDVKKSPDCVMRSSWCHWSQVLASKLGSITATANTRVSAQSDLPPVHDCWIVGNEIVAIFAVLGDDGITRPPCKI